MAMNVKQVTDALAEAFASARIVFWNDAGEDFLSLFDGEMFSPVEGVSVIRLDQTPALQAKLRIEREEPETKLLLYSPTPELEDPLDDWLFDIQLYARQFYADYTVTVLQDLGLTSLALREHLGSRRKFLDLPWFAPPESLSLKVATFKGGRSGGRSRVAYPSDSYHLISSAKAALKACVNSGDRAVSTVGDALSAAAGTGPGSSRRLRRYSKAASSRWKGKIRPTRTTECSSHTNRRLRNSKARVPRSCASKISRTCSVKERSPR
jgi:hypothetical protein